MAGQDEYERRYMGGEGITYESKARASGGFHAIVWLPTILTMAILAYAMAVTSNAPPWLPFVAIPSLVVTVPIWLLFSVLRTTVTSSHVHVQYGLFGPKIPLERITACEAVTYDWKKYGGFGIRRGRDGSQLYNMMGDQGRAVRIVWRDEGGETTTLVSARDPDAMARAILGARAAATPPPGVRIHAVASPTTPAPATTSLHDGDLRRELDAERELVEEAEAAATGEPARGAPRRAAPR